ncbi:hypothetical protein BO85DRAFT_66348 [Aspergillus piperis CBS 112811]|uniref:Uncharacterized protein n=1 Tax=Aspergillus piperis CBS 112811 TaxID=1448313 RepID=A0A8G1QZM5_9EURO|nr:hypothetical protein BO85DRAFT_66348 [Aspergillus piperis CBS 112811]RAH55812.1 hypothetical protein BO85DRAFT_66348 [Aspergillus piperis CBS 112811]
MKVKNETRKRTTRGFCEVALSTIGLFYLLVYFWGGINYFLNTHTGCFVICSSRATVLLAFFLHVDVTAEQRGVK